MKILHIIDSRYFDENRKTISELLLALYESGVTQEIAAADGESLGWLDTLVPFSRFKRTKDGRSATFANKVRMWRAAAGFSPDVAIKWGREARELGVSGSFVQVSHLSAREAISSFDRSDYIMTNLEGPLKYAKENGFSGAKSFMLPPFVKNYRNVPELSKRGLFIPEKAKVIYAAATFARGIGYEAMFDAVGSVQDVYFVIAGAGRDEEYVKDYASRVNVKARSRFVPDVEKTQSALSLSDIALLPFDEPDAAKHILEAMMARKLVVTIRGAVAREFVADGKTGIVVPPRDAYLLRRSVKEALGMDDAERAEITEAAYEFASQYAAAKVVPGYISALEELARKYNSRKNLLNA
jgi:glycosyltransferase involved in cell wall biosynthesis